MKKDYYAVIEHCSEVLQHDPSNVKALYRRAKAHVGAWNPDDAKNDYHKCLALDKSLKTKIARELDDLSEQIRVNELNNKLKFQKMFDWIVIDDWYPHRMNVLKAQLSQLCEKIQMEIVYFLVLCRILNYSDFWFHLYKINNNNSDFSFRPSRRILANFRK